MKNRLKKHKLLITTVIALVDTVGKEYVMDKYDLTYEDIEECYRQMEMCPLVKKLFNGNTVLAERNRQ